MSHALYRFEFPMMRVLFFVLLSSYVFGCNENARSQEPPYDPPPQRVEALSEGVADDVMRSRQTAITRAVEAATPAVVSINVIEVQQVQYRDPFADFFSDPFFEQFFGRGRSRVVERQVQGLGSGFVISPDGYIVTNDHVAGRATRITISFPDGRTLDARLVGSDPATDIALLKVEPDQPLPYLAFNTAGPPIVGEWVIALGNPFGLFEASEPTVTVGVVSARSRDLQSYREGRIYRDMIQTDAAVNRGNSGGPLVNALGEVIGVNTAIYSESGGSIGIGFAVPAEKVQRIVDELREKGTIDRSYYTGLHVVDMNERIARAMQLHRMTGAFVRDIDQGSPGEEAGLLPYDLIIAIEGRPVNNSNDYVGRIYDFRPGDRVRVTVIREGQQREVIMQIGRLRG
jgi:serine protease Do